MLHAALAWLLRIVVSICLFDLLLILLGLAIHYRSLLKRRQTVRALGPPPAASESKPISPGVDLKP